MTGQWYESTLGQLGILGILLAFCGTVIRELWRDKLARDKQAREDILALHALMQSWIGALNEVAEQLKELKTATNALADAARIRLP